MALLGLSILTLVCLVILFTLLGTLLWNKKNSDGVFMACGDNDAQIGWSNDGSEWNAGIHADGGTPFGSGGTAININKGRDLWVAAGNPDGDRTRQLVWSNDDGNRWNDSTGTQFSSASGAQARVVQYGNNIWVAGGSPGTTGGYNVLHSTDGKQWGAADGEPFGTNSDATVANIQYLNDRWLAAGNGGTGGGTTAKIWYSINGTSWSAATGSPFGTTDSTNPSRFAYGDGVYVAVGGSDDQIWYSTDGIDWTAADSHPFGSGGVVWDVKFYDGQFVTVGQYVSGGALTAWSTDGDTWEAGNLSSGPSTDNSLDNIQIPNEFNQYWLITGGTDGTSGASLYYTSTDGREWNIGEQTLFSTGNIQSSAAGFEGRKFDSTDRTLVVGISGTNQNVFYSQERAGITWTAATNAADVFGIGVDKTIVEARYG